MFNKDQDAFVQLSNTISEGTVPVYLWIGAGMSRQAGLPSWAELKTELISRGRDYLRNQGDSQQVTSNRCLLDVAENTDNMWQAFEYMYKAMGAVEFDSAIATIFQPALRCALPRLYAKLLSIRNIRGVITTNIDKLISRALVEELDKQFVEFSGFDCRDYLYMLSDPRFLVLDLHGVFEKRSSLVMKKTDFGKLCADQSYLRFMQSLFAGKSVVFVGVNPMDDAVRVHLEKTRNYEQAKGTTPLYWITDIVSDGAREFCNRYNIRQIVYSPEDGHRELADVVNLLNRGKSVDDDSPEPGFVDVPRIGRSVRNFAEVDFDALSSEDARNILNKKAAEILAPGDAASYARYDEFLKQYKREIHNAWFVDKGEKLLGMTIEKEVGDGAFGRVYRAVDDHGEAYAIKVLKEDVMWKRDWLQSFRRGVRAMKILKEKNLPGIVKYKSASEIPAIVVMEWIEGPDLYEAVQQKKFKTWREKMHVLTEICKIIKTAHALPERVLHRDIRPKNIMLRDFYNGDDDWSVCVLDFDLAFHKGANEVSMQPGFGNGFSAPEQTVLRRGGQTRSSRVDSYGFAMLCYFVITGKMPIPGQCRMEGWQKSVMDDVATRTCPEWISLPYKMAEIINTCTAEDQSKRKDLYCIYDYLSALQGALLDSRQVRMPELLMDELAYRIAVGLRCQDQMKSEHDGGRSFTSLSGTNYKFTIEDQAIRVDVSWYNDGHQDFAAVKKTLGDKANSFVGSLRGKGFADAHLHFEGNGVRVYVSLGVTGNVSQRLDVLAGLMLKNMIAPRKF